MLSAKRAFLLKYITIMSTSSANDSRADFSSELWLKIQLEVIIYVWQDQSIILYYYLAAISEEISKTEWLIVVSQRIIRRKI